MIAMKVKLKTKIVALAILPLCVFLMIFGLLKQIFYTISLLTEEVGAFFDRIDSYIAIKFKKFIKWVNQ